MQAINAVQIEDRFKVLARLSFRLSQELEMGYDWYPLTAAELAERIRALRWDLISAGISKERIDERLAELDELAKDPYPPIEDPSLYGTVYD